MTAIDPKLADFATPRQKEFMEAIAEHGSERAAARALGLNKSSVHDSMCRLKKSAARLGYAPGHFESETAPGFSMGKVTVQRGAGGNVERTWERQSPDQEHMAEMMRAAAEAMAEELPRADPVPAPASTIDALCNLVVFSDYHIGQLSWHREGGADWNLEIAEKLLLDSFIYMIDTSPQARSCVLCLQGDQLHTDGLLPLTPAHKNVLDSDGRFSKIVATAIRVICSNDGTTILMTNQPCKCGKAPEVSETIKQGIDRQPIYILRLTCECGRQGAALLYGYPHQRERMLQSAWDGWNLALVR